MVADDPGEGGGLAGAVAGTLRDAALSPRVGLQHFELIGIRLGPVHFADEEYGVVLVPVEEFLEEIRDCGSGHSFTPGLLR
jgi:hypothetical protein